MQVVQDMKQWERMTHALEELANAVEEVKPLLFGRQLQRRWYVVKYLSKLWKDFRYLARVFTERGTEARGPSAQRLLKHFNVRDIGG